jgi:hypothetical protein
MLGPKKLRRVLWTTQLGWEVKSGALFLESSESVQLCWVGVKGCHIWGPPAGSVHQAYVDWHGKHTCRVGRVWLSNIALPLNLAY